MKLDDLTAAVQPLATAFSRELAGVLHRHFTARVDAVRKAAVAQLREDLEDDDAKPAERPGARGGPRASKPQRRSARRDRPARRRHQGADKGVLPAPARRATSGRKEGHRCGICGQSGHNRKTCPGAGPAIPEAHDRASSGPAGSGPRPVASPPPPRPPRPQAVEPAPRREAIAARASSPAPSKAPPLRSSTGSRESKPLRAPAPSRTEPSSDDDEEPVDVSRRIAPLPPVVLSTEEKRERELARQRARPRRGRAARGVPRARTISVKRITRAVLAAEAFATTLVPAEVLAERPRTRGDCIGGERPCPWVSCKHHLYLDVNPETGSIKINFPDRESWELQHTCSLDVADLGGVTLEEVGQITNLTRERVRQLEVRGLLALRFHQTLSAAQAA